MVRYQLEYDFQKLLISFSSVENKMLQYVLYELKKILVQRFLRGQEIFLSAYPKDKKGRRTVNYTIKNTGSTLTGILTSYPLNLFEHSYINRGNKVIGKKILTKKLPPIANNIVTTKGTEFMNNLVKGIQKNA